MGTSEKNQLDALNAYAGHKNPSTGRFEKLFTTAFVKVDGRILLGYKARGFGAGLWNGFGGKVEEGETIEDCARRELAEESGLIAKKIKQLGIVKYVVRDFGNEQPSVVHIFVVDGSEGQITTSEEMNPIRWFKFEDVPYNDMWPDAKWWYPYMLNDTHFYAYFEFNKELQITLKDIAAYKDVKDVLKCLSEER